MSLTEDAAVRIHSMYDLQSDADENKYFPSELYSGYGIKKMSFIFNSVYQGIKSDTIILSHINLLLVGWLIKLFSPRTKIFLFAHGIKIWGPLSIVKKRMIKSCDKIIAVSNYTAEKINELQLIKSKKITVLNNCLDPFLPLGKEYIGNHALRQKYGYAETDKVLFTLTRLSSKERYKGYDRVLQSLAKVKEQYPEIKYIIAGSYDEKEKQHIDLLTQKLGLETNLKIVGFIPDEALVAHFSMADIYVMPSMKEGFGIVFIEAMNYGLPVIAGNKDGSVDALCNGKLGILVDPTDTTAIENAIIRILKNKASFVPDRKLLLSSFSYEVYKERLENILSY